MDGSWAWLPILQRLRVFSYFSSLTNLFMWSAQHFICYNVKEFIPLYLDKFNNFDSRRSWVITSESQTHSTVLLSQCTKRFGLLLFQSRTFYVLLLSQPRTLYVLLLSQSRTLYVPFSFVGNVWVKDKIPI